MKTIDIITLCSPYQPINKVYTLVAEFTGEYITRPTLMTRGPQHHHTITTQSPHNHLIKLKIKNKKHTNYLSVAAHTTSPIYKSLRCLKTNRKRHAQPHSSSQTIQCGVLAELSNINHASYCTNFNALLASLH